MEASSSKILHHIDAPASWSSLPRCLVIRGWGFSADGNLFTAIRAKIETQTFAGSIGIPRPDVRAAIKSAPSDDVGFEITAVLLKRKNRVVVEAQLPDGSWHTVLSKSISRRRYWLPSWLGLNSATEAILLQTPTSPQYAPRPIRADTFPALGSPAEARPRITIVTPSFQQATYLPVTLQSVLGQTDVNCTYIVQDGGSTDRSVEILKQYLLIAKDPSSSISFVWESGRDSGQADAIIRGFGKSSGDPDDLMGWLNSDDFYQPGALAFVADYFANHPEIDVIYSHRILVDENSQEIGRWFLPPHDDEILRLNDFVPQETLFWRRRIWNKAGGLDKSYQFAMDWVLLLRFQAAGARMVRVPYFLACFRIHPAQKTSAAMRNVGQREIDSLRERTFKRPIYPAELETHPRLLQYLRRSAWIEFLWKWGIRAR